MQITVDGVDLYELTDAQMNVFKHEIPSAILDQDLKTRLKWVLIHKHEQIFKRFKAEWDPKLVANGVESVPVDRDAYAALVFEQSNYKDIDAKNAESQI